MEIKEKVLEDLINKAILDVERSSVRESESFAIHENTRTQVQIIITRNKNDFHEELRPEYVEG